MVFQGGQAFGALAWGVLAQHIGLVRARQVEEVGRVRGVISELLRRGLEDGLDVGHVLGSQKVGT